MTDKTKSENTNAVSSDGKTRRGMSDGTVKYAEGITKKLPHFTQPSDEEIEKLAGKPERTVYYCEDCDSYVPNYSEHNADHTMHPVGGYTKKSLIRLYRTAQENERKKIADDAKLICGHDTPKTVCETCAVLTHQEIAEVAEQRGRDEMAKKIYSGGGILKGCKHAAEGKAELGCLLCYKESAKPVFSEEDVEKVCKFEHESFTEGLKRGGRTTVFTWEQLMEDIKYLYKEKARSLLSSLGCKSEEEVIAPLKKTIMEFQEATCCIEPEMCISERMLSSREMALRFYNAWNKNPYKKHMTDEIYARWVKAIGIAAKLRLGEGRSPISRTSAEVQEGGRKV